MNYWYYYLHENGDLIGKNPAVVESDVDYFDSPFVRKVWKIDLSDRSNCWDFILEATKLGARSERVLSLMKTWGLDQEDSLIYEKVHGLKIEFNESGLPVIKK